MSVSLHWQKPKTEAHIAGSMTRGIIIIEQESPYCQWTHHQDILVLSDPCLTDR